jgi:thiamine biosynthesis lipoprotein
MASPCEVRMDTKDGERAMRLGVTVETEARRIERKFSRYRDDNVVARINGANGSPVEVDDETAALIDYAAQFHRLSEGRFDITSGALRSVWRFDGSDRIPSKAQVRAVLPLVGWGKVIWRRPVIALPCGMEIDFGGIGKEYAVDTCLLKVQALSAVPTLVNFGGDLRVSGPRASGARWRVAIESVDRSNAAEGLLEVSQGALTTSGDARRFLLKDGVRYSHILDPRTGWPVKDPPRSVTVAAPTCIEAGLLSTLAMMHGRSAEKFLQREGIQAWLVW